MLWLKKNWLWLAVNIIAIVLLVSMLNNFSFDFSDGIVPTVTIEQSSFDGPDRLPDDTVQASSAVDTVDSGVQDTSAETTFAREPRSALSGLIHVSGEWAIRWLVLSLSCTPLFILFNWRQMLSVKKVTGLYAFTFATLHFLFFAADRGWNLLATFDEFNFVMGLISVLIMVPLALTSTEWSMKQMGRGWKLLHRAAYAAGIFAVLHLAFLGEGSAVLYAVLLAAGFALRIPKVRKSIANWRAHRKQRQLKPLVAKS